ncbi:MAG: alpha-galactosidase, partial [Bacteroidales bacterium]|nr:alpha-galactosidase [Bacteroidales bacterium]
GITVKVKANQPVETSQKLTTGDDGFQRLSITLSNNGTESVAIESIVVQVPLSDTLSEKMKVAYGGSAMGTPVLVHKVGEQQKESLSFMYAMVQMKPDNYLFAGSLSWRIFLPEFKLEDNAFVIQTNGEGKVLKPGESINYEQIVLSRSKSWQNLLDTYGSAIAKENGVNQLKDVEYRGWATWDYYGGNFSDEDIYENIKQIKEIAPLSNLIQIDAGWYSQMGDFSTPRPDLPGGIKAIADSINAAGMTPGVWIDGFRANTDSEIFKNHPEYFLHDEEGNVIFHDRTSVKTVFFDYSHPGTSRYMAECIRVLKEEKGFPYFKVDFIGYGLNRNILKGTKTFKGIKPYDPSITDVERVRIGLKAIRKAIGPENYFLGL